MICQHGDLKQCSLGCSCRPEVVSHLACLECGRFEVTIPTDNSPVRCTYCKSTLIELVDALPPVVDYRDTVVP